MTIARWRAAVVAAAVAAAGGALAAPVPSGPTDDQLKERVLKLNDLTNTDAMQAQLSEILKDKDTAKRLVKLAQGLQKDGDKQAPAFKYNAALVLAKVAHSTKEYDAAEAFYKVCAENATKLQSGAKMVQSYDGLMDLYWEQKKYKSVEEACRKLMDAKGDDADKAQPYVMEKLIQSKAKQGDTDEALRMAEALVQAYPGEWFFLQVKGWVQREAGKLDDAIATYEDVLDKLEESKLKDELKTKLKRNVRYMMTGLYVDDKKLDKAADILEKLIKDDPDNPTYYNDLGFIWADHDKNLDKSEEMIRKALDLDAKQRKKLFEDGKIDAEAGKKENAAYLDSLGWVLFKKKDFKGAAKYLKEAVKDDDEGQHIEIWDHLADCQFALGETKEAVDIWQKALKFEDASKRDIERRKKVTEKLKKAKAADAK